MASIRKRPDGKWRARYRDGAGKEHARHFARKVDAQRWLDEVTASVVTGQYVDPKSAKTTVREYATAWQKLQIVRSNTRNNRASALRVHILPALGDRQLGSVRRSDVQAFVKSLEDAGLAPGTVAGIYKTLNAVFTAAVDDRVIASSPCTRIRLPENHRPEVVPPTVAEVGALREAMPARYAAAIVLLAGSGLRISELLGLRVSDVNFLRRTVKVERQRLRTGGTGPVKTKMSDRSVPIGKFVVDALAEHLADHPSDEWLFTDELGRPVTYSAWQDIWAPAKAAAKVDVDTHALRHFYASALINGGASVKVVQVRLGHGSASVTLNTYGHLWPDDDELTRTVMDAAFAPLADSLRTEEASGA